MPIYIINKLRFSATDTTSKITEKRKKGGDKRIPLAHPHLKPDYGSETVQKLKNEEPLPIR